MEVCNERTLEVINKITDFAKIDRSDLQPTVQTVHFSSTLNDEDVRLLELDADCFRLLEVGERLVLRGDESEAAVLCTREKTYELKEAETSNSLLLVPDVMFPESFTNTEQNISPKEVTAVLHNYFELRPCKPKLKKLKDMLTANMFSGYECEEDEEHSGRKYTLAEILDSVQASEEEIKAQLVKLHALEIDGYMRMFHCDYETKVLGFLTQLVEENSWEFNRVPLVDCVSTLQDIVSSSIVKHMLDCYGTSSDEEGNTVYKLNEEKICRLFAELILKHTDKFNLHEFLDAWQQSVPMGMRTDLNQLQGMVLVDRSCRPEVIKYFPVEDLPEDPGERFDVLFRTREKWTLDDITPYITDLTTDKQNVGALLLKYARSSMLNGVKVYNSKKPL